MFESMEVHEVRSSEVEMETRIPVPCNGLLMYRENNNYFSRGQVNSLLTRVAEIEGDVYGGGHVT